MAAPNTAWTIFAELIDKSGIPPGVINIVTGLGEEAGDALVRHPLVRGVTFTGSIETGRKIMSAAALLARTDDPSDAEIDTAMSGNICRCGTYPRIRAAIRRAAASRAAEPVDGEAS